MAEFNPETPQAPNTNWLNASQGYQSNKVIGNLFKGFAETVDTGIKSYAETKRTQISLAANAGVDNIVNSKPTEPVQVPEGLKASLGKLDQYKNALDQGVMTDLEFKVRLDKTAKEMRRTFGSGYGDLIDNALANAQGVSTANQVRDELLKQVDAENRNADDMTKRKMNFLEKEMEFISNPNVLAQYEAYTGSKFNPNDYNYSAMLMAVSAQKSIEHTITTSKAKLELDNATNDATVEQSQRVAGLEVSQITRSLFNAKGNPVWRDFENARVSSSDPKGPGGATVTPEEKAQLEGLYANLENQVRLTVRQKLTDPNEPYAVTLTTEKQRQDIENIALGELQIYKDSMFNEQYGIFGATARQAAAISADATYNILADPVYGKIQAKIASMKTLGFDMDLVNGAFQAMSFTGKDGKPVNGAAYQRQMLQEQIFANFLASDKGTAELITAFTNAGLPPIQTKKALEERVKLVTNPSNDPEKAAQMMRNLFADPESQNFIEEFASTDPMGMFGMLASKQMTDKMYGTEMWGQYLSWSLNQFNGIAVPLKSDIIKGQTGTDTTFIKWDGKQFSIDGAGAKVLLKSNPLTNPVGYANNAVEYNNYRNVLMAVNNMNAYISLLDYAVSKDGETIAPYIENLFDGIPVQDQKKQGSMLTQMKQAIVDLNEEMAKAVTEENKKRGATEKK
jgi:hypothetical protein